MQQENISKDKLIRKLQKRIDDQEKTIIEIEKDMKDFTKSYMLKANDIDKKEN